MKSWPRPMPEGERGLCATLKAAHRANPAAAVLVECDAEGRAYEAGLVHVAPLSADDHRLAWSRSRATFVVLDVGGKRQIVAGAA